MLLRDVVQKKKMTRQPWRHSVCRSSLHFPVTRYSLLQATGVQAVELYNSNII